MVMLPSAGVKFYALHLVKASFLSPFLIRPDLAIMIWFA